jgi:hypothetical protein
VAGALALLDELFRGTRDLVPQRVHAGRLSAMLAGLRACGGGGGGGSGAGAPGGALSALPGLPPPLAVRLRAPLCPELLNSVAQWRRAAAGDLRSSPLQREVARALRGLCASSGLPPPQQEVMVEGFAVDLLVGPPPRGAGGLQGASGGGGAAGRVAVEVEGPSHDGLPPGEVPAGRAGAGHGLGIAAVTGFKAWVVGAAGFEVVRVPWREWNSCCGDRGEQQAYLRARLLRTGLAPFIEKGAAGN